MTNKLNSYDGNSMAKEPHICTACSLLGGPQFISSNDKKINNYNYQLIAISSKAMNAREKRKKEELNLDESDIHEGFVEDGNRIDKE